MILWKPQHLIFIFCWNFHCQLKSNLSPLLERCEREVANIFLGKGSRYKNPSYMRMSHVSAPQDLVISAAIMAGFLPAAAEASLRTQINEQLAWLYENDVCAYEVALPGGARPKGPSINDVTFLSLSYSRNLSVLSSHGQPPFSL